MGTLEGHGNNYRGSKDDEKDERVSVRLFTLLQPPFLIEGPNFKYAAPLSERMKGKCPNIGITDYQAERPC